MTHKFKCKGCGIPVEIHTDTKKEHSEYCTTCQDNGTAKRMEQENRKKKPE